MKLRHAAALAAILVIGSIVPVAGQTEDQPPVEFEGRLQCCFRWLEISDARLDGTVRIEAHEKRIPEAGYRVWHEAFRITNDEGSWHELPSVNLTFPENVAARRVGAFIGAGAYEGLTAVAELWYDRSTDVWEVRGVLYEGELPRTPAGPPED